ncbi:MAG TPA: hypothetical protein VGI31_06665 [Streptosporangiaceae bacterium]|jgi:hypothetical protein
MRKRISAIIVAGGAAALTLGLTTAPSFATTAKTWTVNPGGVTSGKAGVTKLTDTASGTVLTCKSSTTSVTLPSGSGHSGTGLGSITALAFNTCTGPLGLTFTVKSNALPWKLNALTYTAATGTTHGSITGIDATLTGSGCSATVDGTASGANNGSVKGTYVNSTHKLKVSPTGGTLHIYNVSGCFGLIANGDASTFVGTYTVTPGQTITSP